MKKLLKITAICIVAALLVIQFFRPDFTNPPVNQAETLEASTEVPENVLAIINRSCKDCHSNETVYPWYSKIQPSAWFLADHINEGRREMNFSVWNSYETRRKRRKLDEICEMVKSRAMPLPSYLWIHWDARTSDDEINILCEWSNRESERLAVLP
jgi:hypothetical protein